MDESYVTELFISDLNVGGIGISLLVALQSCKVQKVSLIGPITRPLMNIHCWICFAIA